MRESAEMSAGSDECSPPSTWGVVEAREAHGHHLENSLLDEIDSYWDDITTSLTVSRMVNDSVIKGMVNAVAEEAAERITFKEAEIAFLNERLMYYESGAAANDQVLVSPRLMLDAQNPKPKVGSCSLRQSVGENHGYCLDRLRVAAEEQIKRIKKEVCHIVPQGDGMIDALEVTLSGIYEHIDDVICPSKGSVDEQQLKQEIQSLIKGFGDEVETKLGEHNGLIDAVKKKWKGKVDKLYSLRQELDELSKALSSSELGLFVPHNHLESLEDCNTAAKRKDHFAWKVSGNHHLSSASHEPENNTVKREVSSEPVLMDQRRLLGMEKEDLISYFKSVITKMNRQHDLVLQEETEKLFSLKREFLKERGSSPLHFRRDKEFELLMRKIPDFMSKLDNILLENENLPDIHIDQAMLCSLKERIDTLFCKHQPQHGLLKDKSREASCFASQVSDAESRLPCYSSREATFAKQIEKLQSYVEDVEIETNIGDQIINLVLSEAVTELRSDMEGLEVAIKAEQDFYSMIYREVAGDAISRIYPVIAEYYQEMNSIAERLREKEEVVISKMEENTILNQEIASLSALIKEKEKFATEAGSKLIREKECFGIVCQELSMLNERVNEQEREISENKREYDMMRGRLDEALQQIHRYELEIGEVNQKLRSMSDILNEAEKQKIILNSNIQEKQIALALVITREEEQKKWMEKIIYSMTELSNAIMDSESRLLDNIKTNESRLISMKSQCIQLVQQAKLLKRKELCYKQQFERRCSDLQMAENEVDLLGDEVDALSSLLEKIHLALDHYSPVLQHYPGVVEVLKLIKREMKGEFAK